MNAILLSFYLFGAIFFLSALAFAYYAFKNARLMHGGLGHRLMAVGGVLFMTAAIVGAAEEFFFYGFGLVRTEFFIWVAGLGVSIAGGGLRAREIKRVHRGPLLRIVTMTPYAKIYLIGITVLLFISLPLSALTMLFPIGEGVNWFDAGNMVVWAFAFVIMAVSEWRLHVAVRSSMAAVPAAGVEEEDMLSREDVLALRAFSDLTSRLAAAAVPMIGVEALRDVLGKCAAEHDILTGCEMTGAGTLRVERAVEKLIKRSEREGVAEVFAGFASLVAQLIELYSAVASPELAQEMVAWSYQTTAERYGEIPSFPRILGVMPAGFLEEEKLTLLSKEELEAKVKERTRELEEALLEARAASEALQANAAALERAKEVAEEAQRVAEAANRAKSTFLANMSHELRTPLSAIIGYSELLQEEAEDLGHTEFVPDLAKIQTASRHLLALIGDLLDLSKVEAGKMELHLETFDLAALVRGVVTTSRPLAAKNGNSLLVDCPDDLGHMHADLTKVRQILLNLLDNAAKFTRQGRITFSVARERAANGAEGICFRVTDTGIGMTTEQILALFQPFIQADDSTTREYGGSGLGLTISHRFCQMMGGVIDVESEEGKGSTFTVYLPAEIPTRRAEFMLSAEEPSPQRLARGEGVK